MRPTTAADWIMAIRVAAPTLSLTALEVLLRVAAGIDNRKELESAIPGVDRATVTRSLQILRGKARWVRGRWAESPVELLQTRPHPHIPGALCYTLSPYGDHLVSFLQRDQ
jgi:hypothetical protein